jgi:succinate dehydrogenase / fumarate reductase flavoprotein subunit
MTAHLSANAPAGPLASRWQRRCEDLELVGPTRRRRHHVLVVGAGLAGASAAASLSELGYRVRCLAFHDSPRRAHSVAAQGGINAAKNYQNDGDSIERLFHDTLKGGDFRARESNVYRLAELSVRIIDHAVAQGVPFAREYGGHLANRSFGGALVSRTFYARGLTGQQLLLGAYQALAKEESAGGVTMLSRREMLDLLVVDGRARGVIARDLVSGALEAHVADAVVLATGGYANVYFLSTNAKASNATAVWRAYGRGAAFANPGFVQFHPTCLPAASEHQASSRSCQSLRNDARRVPPLGRPRPQGIPESERDYFSSAIRATATVPTRGLARSRRCACRAGRRRVPVPFIRPRGGCSVSAPILRDATAGSSDVRTSRATIPRASPCASPAAHYNGRAGSTTTS